MGCSPSQPEEVGVNAELLLNAMITGVLLGGFYAAVTLGLTMTFGLLDVPQVAHPVFIVAGGYGVLMLERLGVPVLLAGILLTPIFFLLGLLVYRFYYWSFERRGTDTGMRGIAFFFGIAFITEITLVLFFGVDIQLVDTVFAGKSLRIGGIGMPYRLIVSFGCSLILAGVLGAFLSRTFPGRAIKAVAQDQMALEIVGANPVRIKELAFAIGTATTGIAGALLLIVSPIDPVLGRTYIGKAFAVAVLAGLGSIKGTLVAATILGVSENVVLATAGTSWGPAISFGLLLIVLIVRPTGLFGR
jgi:branched-chain amino acid transport system permease protein